MEIKNEKREKKDRIWIQEKKFKNWHKGVLREVQEESLVEVPWLIIGVFKVTEDRGGREYKKWRKSRFE